MPVLKHVAKVPLRIDLERRGGLRRDPRADDEVQQAPQHREEEVAEADEAARTRDRTGRRVGHREGGARSPAPSCPFAGGTLVRDQACGACRITQCARGAMARTAQSTSARTFDDRSRADG